MGKRYLLITNIEEKEAITTKFLEFFMKKTFVTDSELFVLCRGGGFLIINVIICEKFFAELAG